MIKNIYFKIFLLVLFFLILYTINNLLKNKKIEKLSFDSKIVKTIKIPIENKENIFLDEYKKIKNDLNNLLRCTDENKIIYPRLVKINNTDSYDNQHYVYGNNKYDLIKINNDEDLDYDEYVLKENDQIIIETKLSKGSLFDNFEGYIVNDFPVFSFNEFLSKTNPDLREVKNIYYKGENYSKKYNLLGASELFEYNNKLGFFGGDEFGEYLFYDDKKYLLDLGLIKSTACCMNLYDEIRVCNNGIMSFLSEKNSGLNIVEIDLNKI